MTKFILHGGFARKENESNRAFYRELIADIPDGGTLLMVYFAAREYDPTENYEILKAKITAEAGHKTINFVYATTDKFIAQLGQADAVFINGGSTSKLLNALRVYDDLFPLLKGKTVAGSSAGAYAIGMLGTSHSEDQLREGMGWAPLRVTCHFESPELPPAPGATALLLQSAPELELVTLRDCEWKAFRY